MGEKLIDKSCPEFAAALASKAPVPGGGGAAALAGALGAALCSMVGNLTVGRKKYAAVEGDIKAILAKAENARARLLELVDEDADCFAPLNETYAIFKDDPQIERILEESTEKACQPPLEMMRLICETISLLEEMLGKGNVNLVSDVGCGALMCAAALESAALNIFINTKGMKNRELAEALNAEAEDMMAEFSLRAINVSREVTRRLRMKG
jgi:formiminotetrahydrofolate cyclodeaminase